MSQSVPYSLFRDAGLCSSIWSGWVVCAAISIHLESTVSINYPFIQGNAPPHSAGRARVKISVAMRWSVGCAKDGCPVKHSGCCFACRFQEPVALCQLRIEPGQIGSALLRNAFTAQRLERGTRGLQAWFDFSPNFSSVWSNTPSFAKVFTQTAWVAAARSSARLWCSPLHGGGEELWASAADTVLVLVGE